MQRQLTEYTCRLVKHVFIPFKQQRRRGLSEKLLRKRLEKQGWSIWRGGLIGIHKELDRYPNVIKRYKKLNMLLEEHYPDRVQELEYICAVHHGMPDLLCYRRRKFMFVECKLGHEQLSRRQKKCIRRLQRMGFTVEVHKLAEDCTKARLAVVDLKNGKRKVQEKQDRLKRKY